MLILPGNNNILLMSVRGLPVSLDVVCGDILGIPVSCIDIANANGENVPVHSPRDIHFPSVSPQSCHNINIESQHGS